MSTRSVKKIKKKIQTAENKTAFYLVNKKIGELKNLTLNNSPTLKNDLT